MVSLQEYANFVAFRMKKLPVTEADLIHMQMGICGEAGEVADVIKKHVIYAQRLDRQHLVEELGDLLFYVQGMANIIEWPLDYVMYENMEKLKKRYPDGYTDEAAKARADKQGEST